MQSLYKSHKQFLWRLIGAAVLVQVVFAVLDYYAFFSPLPGIAAYDMMQWLFPVGTIVTALLAAYFIVCRYVAPVHRRALAAVMVFIVSLLVGIVLGFLYLNLQSLDVLWLNGSFWPGNTMLGMSFDATIALYVYPLLSFGLASAIVMKVVRRNQPQPKKRTAKRRTSRKTA